MKRLLSVATISALLAVGGYASSTAFAANVHASPSTTTVTGAADQLLPTSTPAPEVAEPVEAPGAESATEPVESGTAAEPTEVAGHADNPGDPNADHEFDGDE
jgi:hypothetical protein